MLHSQIKIRINTTYIFINNFHVHRKIGVEYEKILKIKQEKLIPRKRITLRIQSTLIISSVKNVLKYYF